MNFYQLQEEEPERKNLKLRGKLFYGHKCVEMGGEGLWCRDVCCYEAILLSNFVFC